MSLGPKGARPVKLLDEPILHSLGRQKKKIRQTDQHQKIRISEI